MTLAAPNGMPEAVRSREAITDDAHIGRYRILRRLDVNATSEQVLAITEGAFGFERAVVIKRLLPHAHADPKRAQRFGQEVSAYARLTHPAIVRLYDFLTVDDMPAMVLEHVDGVSLETLLTELRTRGEKLPVEAALYIGARVFAALGAAHGARDPVTRGPAPVIHRDVSPANVLLGTNADVKLSNFGFAKLAGSGNTDLSLQIPKGTLGYMAPEQLLNEPVTPATDVYAGALLVRELLTGTPAFVHGDEPYVDYLQKMAEPSLAPIAVVRPDLPAVVIEALETALSPASAKRRLTAVDMQRVLNAHRVGGRAKLKEVLARLDFGGVDESEEQDPFDDSSVTAPSTLRLESRARRARIAAATFAVFAVLSGGVTLRQGIHVARGSTPPVAAVAPPIAHPALAPPVARPAVAPVAPPPATEPAPAAAAKPAPAVAPAVAFAVPVEGDLEVPASAPTHRVFIDGHLAGESGATFTVACGIHTVRVGGGGKAQSVNVPCGGKATLGSR